MLRRLYSEDPDYAPPLVEIVWSPKQITEQVRSGKLKVELVGPMFSKALGEIRDAILKGKQP